MIDQFRKSPAYDCDKYGGMSVAVPPVEQYLPLLFLLPSCSFRPASFLPARWSIPSKAGEVVTLSHIGRGRSLPDTSPVCERALVTGWMGGMGLNPAVAMEGPTFLFWRRRLGPRGVLISGRSEDAKSQEPSRARPFSAQLGELGTGSTDQGIGTVFLISLNNEPSYQSINHHRFVSFSLCTLQVPCWGHVR